MSQEDMGFQCIWNNDQVPAAVDIPVVLTSWKPKKISCDHVLTPAAVPKL